MPTPVASSSGRALPTRAAEAATKDDLTVLITGCLKHLSSAIAAHRAMPMTGSQQLPQQQQAPLSESTERTIRAAAKVESHLYARYLVTATFCLGLAPRSQILKQLRIGSSFVKENGRYWMKLLAEQSKDGKPTLLAIPDALTQAYDHYLEHVRPLIAVKKNRTQTSSSGVAITPGGVVAAAAVAAAAAAAVTQHTVPAEVPRLGGSSSGWRQHGADYDEYVFVKRDGSGPRPEFTSFTTAITLKLLGKVLTAHSFRTSVITSYYESGATQSEMDTLARLMSHDSATAKAHYFRPQFTKSAVDTNSKVASFLMMEGGANQVGTIARQPLGSQQPFSQEY